MATYLEYQFTIKPLEPVRDILSAELADLGFESFMDTNDGLSAYIKSEVGVCLDLEGLWSFANEQWNISWEKRTIPHENWNQVWESGFNPVTISDQCRIRAPFHEKSSLPFEIVIEPKMSFGTGHHETTHTMAKLLLEEDNVAGKTVLDMGSGTGILAILARMMGAKNVTAIDIDPICFESAKENVVLNGVDQIEVLQGDSDVIPNKKYDIVLANINKNILLRHINQYVATMTKGSALFLSGFYLEDLPDITKVCADNGLSFEKKEVKNNWVVAKYVF